MDRSEAGAENTIPRKVTSPKQSVRKSTFAEWFLMDVFRAILNCQVQQKRQCHNLYTRCSSPGEYSKKKKKSKLYPGGVMKKKKSCVIFKHLLKF